jgi:hypothetical protein
MVRGMVVEYGFNPTLDARTQHWIMSVDLAASGGRF